MTLPGPTAADTRARFLASIAEVVPAERIAEIHFFPPIRQGPIETGVAVVGAEPVPIATAAVAHEDGESPYAPDEPSASAPVRHVVFMARYRWTRKGPERGKWSAEVIAEADAPLVTVEAVAKGVGERANEAGEPERITGDQARAMLADRMPTP